MRYSHLRREFGVEGFVATANISKYQFDIGLFAMRHSPKDILQVFQVNVYIVESHPELGPRMSYFSFSVETTLARVILTARPLHFSTADAKAQPLGKLVLTCFIGYHLSFAIRDSRFAARGSASPVIKDYHNLQYEPGAMKFQVVSSLRFVILQASIRIIYVNRIALDADS